MASIHQRSLTGLEHRRHSKEKMDSNMLLDEKTPTTEFVSDEASIDARDGDEALELVGVRRKTQFSEEYNLKLRKKLDWVIAPLSAAVYFTQYLDKTTLNYAKYTNGTPLRGLQALIACNCIMGFLITGEFPTQFIAQKLRLDKYLGVNVVI
ncbi:hypothetical protein ACEPAF_8223 [Sanghuangporus sanghuang]